MHSGDQIDCRVAMAQLWEFLDEELTVERMVAVRQHLQACKSCHPHAQFAERFLEALGQCRCRDTMPESARQRVVERLRSSGLMA
ncbi:MAG: zf-HC2 domain-containing protein [Gemmatimonadaceae bacterium]